MIKAYVENIQYKLYSLIWKRTLATQMAQAKIANTTYKIEAGKNKEYEFLRSSLPYGSNEQRVRQTYQDAEVGHLGKVTEICLNYGDSKDKLNNPQNQKILTTINQTQDKISRLEQANNTIRQQYDSTLLEKIAGQSSGNSINQVRAEKAKQELTQNSEKISTFKQEITNLQNQLLTKTESINFLSFIKARAIARQLSPGRRTAPAYPLCGIRPPGRIPGRQGPA
jgi:DNA topoisomerase IA